MHIRLGLIGATNVGKSTLFNRLIGQYRAIVTDIHGTTRDIIRHEIEKNGIIYEIADSPGLGSFTEEIPFLERLIRESDVLLFVVDAHVGITAKEEEIHHLILHHQAKKKVILVVNKAEKSIVKNDSLAAELPFYRLGYETIVSVSAKEKKNIDKLWKSIDKKIGIQEQKNEQTNQKGSKETKASSKSYEQGGIEKEVENEENGLLEKIKLYKERYNNSIHLAIAGKPNAGKSTLLNTLVGEYVSKVEDTPGTTLDYITAKVQKGNKTYVVYDTMGIRKRGKIRGIEAIGYKKTFGMLAYVKPVVVYVLDGIQGLSHRDKTLLEEIYKTGSCLIIAINKIDLMEVEQVKKVREYVSDSLLFAKHIPIVEISAKEGKGVQKLLETVDYVWEQSFTHISTSELNKIIQQAFITNPPRFPKNKVCKIFYLTQTDVHPYTFKVFVNYIARANFSFKKRIENVIRKHYLFPGCPIYIDFAERKRDNIK